MKFDRMLKNWEKKKQVLKKKKIEKRKSLAQLKRLRDRIKKKTHDRQKYKLRMFLERAGVHIDTHQISKWIFNICIGINLVISGYLLWFFSGQYEISISYILFVFALLWIFVFLGIVVAVWLLFNLMLDLRIFQRKVTIEEVLPDYLQLTASNIRSGMTIDQALWLAVRPRFGVLAAEIELVAKQTMSGGSLVQALQDFSNRYDSLLLRRSMNLLIVGLESGGEIGELLDKIASNIKEAQILKKEMSANVASYAIFITFASIVGAPFLFGLSDQLLRIIQTITSDIEVPRDVTLGIGVGFGGGIEIGDFRIFAIVSLIITAFFSAAIVSIIRKGSVKQGMRSLPLYAIVSIALFYIFASIFEGVFSGLF